MEEKKTIGIWTSFYNFSPAYSLVSVVRDQLVMNVKYGYKTVLFVLPSFEGDVPEGVEVRKVVPALILEKYKGNGSPPDFKEDVKQVVEALKKHVTENWVRAVPYSDLFMQVYKNDGLMYVGYNPMEGRFMEYNEAEALIAYEQIKEYYKVLEKSKELYGSDMDI